MMFPKKRWGWSRGRSKVSLAHKLDKVFSEFIRLRDIRHAGIGSGFRIRCITCGNYFLWKEADAGHFIARNHKATRWDEKNVNGQCRSCNRFHSGEQYAHGIAIDKRYGAGTAENLRLKSRMKFKTNDMWFIETIKHYREEVKKMKAEMGL